MKFREEILNTALAQILREYGLAANPEIIISNKLPDVRIIIGGIKVILEGKIETAKKALQKQTRERLEDGLADISLAIYYRKNLYEAPDADALKRNMQKSTYSGVVYHWGNEGMQHMDFESKSVQDLVEILNRIFTLYTKNNLLANKVKEIEEGINRLTGEAGQTSLSFQTGITEKYDAWGKLKKVLGIGEEIGEEREE